MKRVILVLSLAAGCASPQRPVEKQPFLSRGPGPATPAAAAVPHAAVASAPAPAEAAAPAAPAAPEGDLGSVDPGEFAKRYPRADECESAARRVRAVSRDRGWAVLRACIARTKFTLLNQLLGEAWAEELRTRPDAGAVLAKVVALRGGDVTGDLGQLRQHRVPLFAIGTAVGHPELYKNRLVLFRGELRDLRLPGKGGAGSAKLSEFVVGGRTYAASRSGPSTSAYGRGEGGYDSKGRRATYGEYDGQGRKVSKDVSYGATNVITQNVPVETGLEVIARFTKADPFFEPGRQFIVLGRFEGVRELPNEDDMSATTTVPVISLLAYFEPSAAIVE